MKNKKLKLITLIVLIFGMQELIAQNSVPASGGDASGSGGTVSYTIGQVFYSSKTANGGTVTEGVQQPVEIFVITGESKTGIKLKISAFPNPAERFVILKIDNKMVENICYRLYDIDGKLLLTEKVTGNETSINISMLKPSVYILKVINDNHEEKTFKIIKN